MINQQLLDYIKQQLNQGAETGQIKEALLIDGWQSSDIEEAFHFFGLKFQEEQLAADQPEISKTENPPLESSQAGSLSSDFTQPPVVFAPPLPKKSKRIPTIIAIIICLLLVGGGTFAYFNYFQSPERVCRKMIEKMEKVKSFEYSGTAKIEVEMSGENSLDSLLGGDNYPETAVPQNTKATLTLDVQGAFDRNDEQNQKTYSVLDLNLGTLAEGVDFSLGLGLETKTIGKLSYFRLTKIPSLGIIDLNSLKNRWFEVDVEKLSELLGPEAEEQLRKMEERQKGEAEQINRLLEEFKESKTLKISEKLSDEKINNTNTYHYKFTIDKEESKKFLRELIKIGESNIEDESLKPKEEELGKGLDELLEKTELLGGEVWIGKKDSMLHKVSFEMATKKTKGVSMKFSGFLVLKDFNKPVQIEIPSSAEPIEEIFKGLFGGILGMDTESPKDRRIISDMDRLRSTAEVYRGNNNESYSGFCASEDENVLETDIKSTPVGGLEYNCYSNTIDGSSYCVEVKLNSGKYWCIDSDLKSKEYDTNPVCAACRNVACKCE